MYVGYNPVLPRLELPQLTSAFSLRISNNESLPFLHLGSVSVLSGDLHIAVNNSLPALSMPTLTHVAGDFYVGSNPAIASFGFGSLATVGGEFRVTHNSSLPTSYIQAVVDALGGSIGGQVVVEENAPG